MDTRGYKKGDEVNVNGTKHTIEGFSETKPNKRVQFLFTDQTWAFASSFPRKEFLKKQNPSDLVEIKVNDLFIDPNYVTRKVTKVSSTGLILTVENLTTNKIEKFRFYEAAGKYLATGKSIASLGYPINSFKLISLNSAKSLHKITGFFYYDSTDFNENWLIIDENGIPLKNQKTFITAVRQFHNNKNIIENFLS